MLNSFLNKEHNKSHKKGYVVRTFKYTLSYFIRKNYLIKTPNTYKFNTFIYIVASK